MDSDLKWLIGVAVSVSVALITTLVAAFRNLRQSNHHLHRRVDEVKDKYVRRDDLDGHLDRLERSVKEVREEMRENHRQLLEAVTRGQ